MAKAAPKTRTIGPSKPGQQPITFKPGGLHKSLGVAQGKKIPPGKMAAAASGSYGPKAKKQANFARNVLGAAKGASFEMKDKKRDLRMGVKEGRGKDMRMDAAAMKRGR